MNPDIFKNRTFLGIESLLRDAESLAKFGQSSYPPYNVVVDADGNYAIHLAVAGFGRENLDVQLDGRTLTISGEKPEPKNEVKFLHRGISTKKFKRSFSLVDHLEVESVRLDHGILSIFLEKQVPDTAKPKSFDIG